MSHTVSDPTKGKNRGFVAAMVALALVSAVIIGFIVAKGKENYTVWSLSDSVPDNLTVELVEDGTDSNGNPSGTYVAFTSENTQDGAPVIEMIEDFQCPFCVQLQQSIGKDIHTAVENGQILQYYPMTYLDEKRGEDMSYSHDTATAIEVLAERGEADAAWKFYHSAWNNHPNDIGKVVSKEEIADIMGDVGASKEAVEQYKNTDNERAKQINDVNYAYLSDVLGGQNVGVPTVLYNGEVQEDPALLTEKLNS